MRYALIDNGSGIVWHINDADTPLDAINNADMDIDNAQYAYEEEDYSFTRTSACGYRVHEVPDGFDVADGQSAAAIAAVETHRRVAVYARVRGS